MYPFEAVKAQLRILRYIGGLPIEPANEVLSDFRTSKTGWVLLGGAVGVVVAGFR